MNVPVKTPTNLG